MNRSIFYLFIALSVVIVQLSFFSCTGNSPNLPKKKLLALMNELSQKAAKTPAFILPDSNYVPPAGVRYTEIRAIDYSDPPAVIDIVGNLNNRKIFKLSDFASSVRYVILRPPPDVKFSSIHDIATDDERIFINTAQGLFCYSTEGLYQYTVVKNELEDNFMGTGSFRVVMGSIGEIDLFNGILVHRFIHWHTIAVGGTDVNLHFFDIKELDAQMFFNSQSNELGFSNATPKYQRALTSQTDAGWGRQYLLMNDQSVFNNNWTITSIHGDTLCKFMNYDQATINRVMQSRGAGVLIPSNIYRISGQMMLQNGHNDTVFRVMPPNRLTPAYVMNWGNYKPDLKEHVAGSALEGKLVLGSWIETPRFIFIHYTEGRNFPTRRDQGKVKFHYAIYNKTAKTLTHHISPTTPAMRQAQSGWSSTTTVNVPLPMLIENDIESVGMPFYPEGLNHKDEMYMIFSKERIADYIASGRYRNDKLQAIYDSMPDDGFCIMFVK